MISKTFPKVKIITLNINQCVENCPNPFSAVDYKN